MALIMTADDVQDIILLLKSILEMHGHQVVSVSDGVQLVEKAKSWHPHLIIADIMMPGAYGSAAYKALLEDAQTADIPIIFITAVEEEKARRVIPQLPKVRLLLKPLDSKILMQTVNELLSENGYLPANQAV